MFTAWRFCAIVFTALLMGTTLGHVLELPAKMKMTGPLWMTLQQTLQFIGFIALVCSLLFTTNLQSEVAS